MQSTHTHCLLEDRLFFDTRQRLALVFHLLAAVSKMTATWTHAVVSARMRM
jgi:hypothetical protein